MSERRVSTDAQIAAMLARFEEKPDATAGDVSTALEVLAQLSGRCDDGELRDQIGVVRNALWDWLEEMEWVPR